MSEIWHKKCNPQGTIRHIFRRRSVNWDSQHVFHWNFKMIQACHETLGTNFQFYHRLFWGDECLIPLNHPFANECPPSNLTFCFVSHWRQLMQYLTSSGCMICTGFGRDFNRTISKFSPSIEHTARGEESNGFCSEVSCWCYPRSHSHAQTVRLKRNEATCCTCQLSWLPVRRLKRSASPSGRCSELNSACFPASCQFCSWSGSPRFQG